MGEISADCHLHDGESIPKCEGLVLHLGQAESVVLFRPEEVILPPLLPSSREGKSGPFV